MACAQIHVRFGNCLRTAKNAWAEPGRTCLVCRSLASRLECIGRGRGPARPDLLPAFRINWRFSPVTFLPLPFGGWVSTPSDRRGTRRIPINWSHSNSMRSATAPSRQSEDDRTVSRCHKNIIVMCSCLALPLRGDGSKRQHGNDPQTQC